MNDSIEAPDLTPEQLAYLNSCPDGESLSITMQLGDVSVTYTRDRRAVSSDGGSYVVSELVTELKS